jgi:hypothetical protein
VIACKNDSDCKLVDTCCLGCVAKGADFAVPPCAQPCVVDPCSTLGAPGVRCYQGACTLANDCDARGVACNYGPPVCLPGELPSVVQSCWSGCVKASSCLTVRDCTECDPQSYLCVGISFETGNVVRCVDIPPACVADRTCACQGPYACPPPYSTCSENAGGTGLACSCPNC